MAQRGAKLRQREDLNKKGILALFIDICNLSRAIPVECQLLIPVSPAEKWRLAGGGKYLNNFLINLACTILSL